MKSQTQTGIGIVLLAGTVVLWVLFLKGYSLCVFPALACAAAGTWLLEHFSPAESNTHAIDIRSTAAQLSQEFGIPVQANRVLADGRTVGDVVHYVCHLLNAESDGEMEYVPLYERAEDAVRETLSANLDVSPDAIRLKTPLASILPRGKPRRAAWRALRQAFGPFVDPLATPRERTTLPGCAASLLAIGIMVVAFSITAIRTALSPTMFAIVVMGLAIIVPSILFVRLKRARASILPLRYVTVGDLVPDAAHRVKLEQGNAKPASWTRKEVALRIRERLSLNARMSLREVTEDKVLGKDIRTT